jgi:hypothetical protein
VPPPCANTSTTLERRWIGSKMGKAGGVWGGSREMGERGPRGRPRSQEQKRLVGGAPPPASSLATCLDASMFCWLAWVSACQQHRPITGCLFFGGCSFLDPLVGIDSTRTHTKNNACIREIDDAAKQKDSPHRPEFTHTRARRQALGLSLEHLVWVWLGWWRGLFDGPSSCSGHV